MSVDLMEEFVRERLGWPEGRVVMREWLDEFDGFRVEVWEREPEPVKTGPRAGKPNWRSGKTAKVKRIYAEADFRLWEAEWSKRTGLCLACTGDGEVFVSWHHIEGTKTKPCRRCGGTGRNP